MRAEMTSRLPPGEREEEEEEEEEEASLIKHLESQE